MTYVAASIVLLAAILAVPLTLLTLPGAWLVIAAAAACTAWQPELISWWTIGACAAAALVGEGVEVASGAVGASRAGGSKTGAAGAIIGTIVGAIVGTLVPPPIIGTILGAAVGAGLGAMLAERVIKKKDAASSAKIAAGAAAGRLVSIVVKATITAGIAVTLSIAAFL